MVEFCGGFACGLLIRLFVFVGFLICIYFGLERKIQKRLFKIVLNYIIFFYAATLSKLYMCFFFVINFISDDMLCYAALCYALQFYVVAQLVLLCDVVLC